MASRLQRAFWMTAMLFGIALACETLNLSERSEQLMKWMGMIWERVV